MVPPKVGRSKVQRNDYGNQVEKRQKSDIRVGFTTVDVELPIEGE
jgi:hypothetical protein